MRSSTTGQDTDSSGSGARRWIRLSLGEVTVLLVSFCLIAFVAIPSFLRALYELRGRECNARLGLIYNILSEIAAERGTEAGEEICETFDINVRLDRMQSSLAPDLRIKVGAEPDCPDVGDFIVDLRLGPDGRPIPPKCALGCWLFCLHDLKDPAALVAKLRDAEDPLSQYLRGQFPDEAKRLLDAYDGSGSPSMDLQRTLVSVLNEVLQGDCLFTEQRFAQRKLDDKITQEIEKNPQGENLVRLNRWLLESFYPRQIVRRDPESGRKGLHRFVSPALDESAMASGHTSSP